MPLRPLIAAAALALAACAASPPAEPPVLLECAAPDAGPRPTGRLVRGVDGVSIVYEGGEARHAAELAAWHHACTTHRIQQRIDKRARL